MEKGGAGQDGWQNSSSQRAVWCGTAVPHAATARPFSTRCATHSRAHLHRAVNKRHVMRLLTKQASIWPEAV